MNVRLKPEASREAKGGARPLRAEIRPDERSAQAFGCPFPRIPYASAGMVLLGMLCISANAQFTFPTTNFARSGSGQFIVHGQPWSARAAAVPEFANGGNYLRLEPALTAISCERIKRALADVLDDKSRWRDKVYLALYPAQSPDDGGTIVAEQFRDGWQYRLELPGAIERARFVRAIVEVLLLERANRNASDHSAEIPIWLSEGLTKQLLTKFDVELTPRRTRWSSDGLAMGPSTFEIAAVNSRKTGRRSSSETAAGNVALIERAGPLEAARRQMRERPPLTLQELSWPDADLLALAGGEVYRNNAQLFVTELMRLNDGVARLRAMLDGLAQCYNWQTAFLRAFQAHFGRPVDLEKWWALQVVHFTGRDFTQTWPVEESWNKLDALLRTPVEVRRTQDELPGHADISLATVIREWDFIRQGQTLRAILQELDLLRMRVAPDLVALVDDYRRVLSVYLEKRGRAGLILPGSKMPSPGVKFVLRDTLEDLAALEDRRAELRPQPAPASTAQAVTDPTKSP